MFTVANNRSEKLESEFNLSNEINNILLVGNGFDLAVGLKTSYSDFVMYLSIKVFLLNALLDPSDNEEYITFLKTELERSKLDKRLKEFFTNLIDNQKKSDNFFVSEKNKLNKALQGKFISDFLNLVLDEELFNILNNKEYLISKLQLNHDYIYKKLEFNKQFFYVRKRNSRGEISTDRELFDATHDLLPFVINIKQKLQDSTFKQWLDVESYIEFLVTNNRDLCARFYPNKKEYNSPLFSNPSLYTEYFNSLDDFCNIFKDYLNDILERPFTKFNLINLKDQKSISKDAIDELIQPFIPSLYNRTHGFLEQIDLRKVDHLINYNYTYVAEAVLKQFYDRNSIIDNAYHINGELDYENHFISENSTFLDSKLPNYLVFGFSDVNSFSKVNSVKCNIKSTLHAFEKKVLRVIKNTSPLDLDKLTSKPFNLLIYGHSCGVADGDVIGKLMKSSNLKIAVVLCLDQISLVSITNNLIEILGQKRFDVLIKNANQKLGNNSLYFAVRHESFENPN